MSELNYKVSVILRKEEEGGFSVQCIELPRVICEGKTREEALETIREAIIRYLEVFPEEKELVQKVREVIGITV